MCDTDFYKQALDEFNRANPQHRRVTDMTPTQLSAILQRAQALKDAATECEMERARR